MKRKSTVMRVQDETLVALRIYSAEQTVKTGKPLSDNEALWQLIKAIRPDIIKRVEKGDYDTSEDD